MYIKMVRTVRLISDDGNEIHPLASHLTKLRNFTTCGIHEFPFSLQLMFDQTLNDLIICLMISQKHYILTLHVRANMLQRILDRFQLSQH